MTFAEQLKSDIAVIEPALEKFLSRETGEGYDHIFEAAKYSAMAGGKRLRPVIVLEFCRLCGADIQKALPFACALEMIHTYSLIHDDLPAMDDDQLRRGRPTNHVVYGEATAILAGDGLLTAAFEQLSKAELPPERVVAAVGCLARNAGPGGMVGGQALDMAGEGRSMTRGELEQLQSLKTGALISAAAELGCIAAGGTEDERRKVRAYAQALGRAFQVQDDILDVTSTDEQLGKTVGSDRVNEKTTFVTALGLEGSRALVEELTKQAVEALTGFEQPEFLIWLAETLAKRTN